MLGGACGGRSFADSLEQHAVHMAVTPADPSLVGEENPYVWITPDQIEENHRLISPML